MIGEIALVWKLVGVLLFVCTGGITFWVNDLKNKHDREVRRIDDIIKSENDQSNRLTKLEAESVTETQVLRMISEMERRNLDNFKEFRVELKEDFNNFKETVKDIFQESQRRG